MRDMTGGTVETGPVPGSRSVSGGSQGGRTSALAGRLVAALASMLAAAACSIAPGSSGADPTASTETTELAPSPEAGGPPLLPEELDWSNLDPDPIVGLPSTEASDRLVVLASSERRTDLVLIDLDREPAVPVKRPSHIGTDIAVSETSVAYTIGERTLGFIDVRRPDLTIEAPLPADVPGLIWDVLGDPLGFVVITVPAPAERPGGPDDPGVIVLYDPAGNLSCVTEARVDWFDVDLFGGVLRTDNLATEIERTDCSTGPGLKDAGEDAVMVGTVDGDPLVAALGAVVRYDSATARRKAASEPLGDHVSSILVTDDAVWAIADGFVLKIDPATLEVVHRAGPLDCDGSPYLLDGGGSLWVIDDCTGILAEVDSLTGNYVEAWWFPTDGMSDQEIEAKLAADGIWFVAHDQTAEPYRFDFQTRRFERMPLSADDAGPIFTLDWEVLPDQPWRSGVLGRLNLG